MKIKIFIIFLLICISLNTYAVDTQFCKNYKLDDQVQMIFPRMADQSKFVVSKFCSGEYMSEASLSADIVSLAALAISDFTSLELPSNVFNYNRLLAKIRATFAEENTAPVINTRFMNGNIAVSVGSGADNLFVVKDVAACDKLAKNKNFNNCKNIISSLEKIYNHAQLMIQKSHTVEVKKYLNIASSAWDNFYKNSRSQTSLEALINGMVWRKNKKSGDFLLPPKGQFIFLHPSVVIENVNEAVDGENTQEGLMIEIAGYNWWQREKWYQVSGVSIVGVYSDRAFIKDEGYGLALYFGNKYALGAVDRDGETGIFISLDLLEILKDKNNLFNSYIEKLR